VSLVGVGWAPGESIALTVDDDEGRSWRHASAVTAADDGAFVYQFRLPDWFVATYLVRATGVVSGTVELRFTDSIGTGPGSTGDNGAPPPSELTLAVPSVPQGRLLLATVVTKGRGFLDVLCAPSGWTLHSSTTSASLEVHTFYRVSTAGEPADATWRVRFLLCALAIPIDDVGMVGAVTAYAGVDVTHSGGPILSVTGATGNGAAMTAPSVAGVAANSIVIRSFGSERAALIVPAAASSTGTPNTQVFSIVRQPPGGGTAAPSAAAADADQPVTGPTGTLSAANGGTGRWAAQTVVLRMRSTQPILQLTIGDTSAQLGTNLTPDGDPSDSPEVVGIAVDTGSPSQGACYLWRGTATVRSSLAYDMTVTAAAPNGLLHFLTAGAPTWDDCLAAEPVGPAMFATAGPSGAWLTDQSATSGRTHEYWLGLDVPWAVAPSVTLGEASLTFRAVVDW
jgi:hypothetical protein